MKGLEGLEEGGWGFGIGNEGIGKEGVKELVGWIEEEGVDVGVYMGRDGLID